MAFFSHNFLFIYSKLLLFLFYLCFSILYISTIHTMLYSGELVKRTSSPANLAGKWTSRGECEWDQRRVSLAGDPWRTGHLPAQGVPSSPSPAPPSLKTWTPATSPMSLGVHREASSSTDSQGPIHSTRKFSGRRSSHLRRRRRVAGTCRCSESRQTTTPFTATYSAPKMTGDRGSGRGRYPKGIRHRR